MKVKFSVVSQSSHSLNERRAELIPSIDRRPNDGVSPDRIDDCGEHLVIVAPTKYLNDKLTNQMVRRHKDSHRRQWSIPDNAQRFSGPLRLWRLSCGC